jgi:hypothetical protein
MLPFALVRRGADLHVELLGETEQGPVGLNLDTAEPLHVGPGVVEGFVNADPAAVFFGADGAFQKGAQRFAADVRRLRPLGYRFRPMPAGVVSGYPMVRSTLEKHRRELPSVETIRLSAVFAGSSIMVGIEQAERSFACMTALFRRAGGFVPLEEIKHCIVSLGLHKIRQRLYVESEAWAHEVRAALEKGLRDRELRRHLLFETKRPATIGLAKTSFTLALLGQDTICLDTRILTRLFPKKHNEIEKSFAKVGPTSLSRYESVEDAFLKGNPHYNASDPIGRARAQWMSWESVGGKGATHSTWLSVVRGSGAREQQPAPPLQLPGTLPAPIESMPVPKGIRALPVSGLHRFAATFLGLVATGDTDPNGHMDDPRGYKIALALEHLGIIAPRVIGGGDYGLAGVDEATGRVVKLTSDPTEVIAGAVLAGKQLEHVARVYSSHFIRGVKVDARIGWDEQTDEEIRKPARVGVLCLEKVRTDIPFARTHKLNMLIRTFKLERKLYPSDLRKLTRAKARAKLETASRDLALELDNINERIYRQIASGLEELRALGIYAIDVHSGNVGYVGDLLGEYTVKIFDVGSSSSPPGQKVPVAAEECGPEVGDFKVPEIGEAMSHRSERDKFESCVRQVKAQGRAVNPWAVCHATLGEAREPRSQFEGDDFLDGYIHAALWSSTDDKGEPLDSGKHDLAPETLSHMRADAARFRRDNADLLERAYSSSRPRAVYYTPTSAGVDFWLTRNRHGAGFLDGDLPSDIGEALAAAARRFGEVYLYVGDDGLIYGSGHERYANEDYIAVDSRGRQVAGPFKHYEPAKREADRSGGTVKFVMEAGGHPRRYTDYYIVDTRPGSPTEGVVAGPFRPVEEADKEFERRGFSHRTHQVINGSFLTDEAFRGFPVLGEDCIGIHTHRDARAALPQENRPAAEPVADEARISSAQRAKLPARAFALPEKRALPLTDSSGKHLDAKHIRAAAARLSMMRNLGHVSKSEAARAHKRIELAAKKVGIAAKELRAASKSGVAEEDFTVATRDDEAVAAGATLPALKDPRAIYDFTAPMLAKQSQEVMLIIPLNIHGHPLSDKPYMVAMGQRDRVAADMSDILRPVIETNAAGFVLVHVHPSTRARPSEADKALTREVKEAAAVACPSSAFLDHVIVGSADGRGEYYSFEDGKVHRA